MFAIVDMQGFYVDGQFCPKELVIYRENKFAYFLFKPRVQFVELCDKDQKTAEFTERFHGLSYNDGYGDLSEFDEIIRRYLLGCELVYVKGDQKISSLRKALANCIDAPQIIDLKQLKKAPTMCSGIPQCLNHRDRIGRCAWTNTKNIVEWIKSHLPK